MNRVLPAVALGGTQRRFQARILVRKEVKGATVLMWIHLATGQADGVVALVASLSREELFTSGQRA